MNTLSVAEENSKAKKIRVKSNDNVTEIYVRYVAHAIMVEVVSFNVENIDS
jgi:hypothetical protein